MIKQKVVRTYTKSILESNGKLSFYLDDGYIVIHVSIIENGTLEYIIQKEFEDKESKHK